jgi:hypothetical protein
MTNAAKDVVCVGQTGTLPHDVEITPDMIEAGLYELKYGCDGLSMEEVVANIFTAMELERIYGRQTLALAAAINATA